MLKKKKENSIINLKQSYQITFFSKLNGNYLNQLR